MSQSTQTIIVAQQPAYFYTHQIQSLKPCIEGYSTFLEQLIYCSCEVLNVKNEDLYTKSRVEPIKLARWIVWEAMIACESYSTIRAGKVFGNHDHSTVVHSLDTLPTILEYNSGVKILYDSIHAKAGIDSNKIAYFHKYRNERATYVSPAKAKKKMNLYKLAKKKMNL